MIVSVRYMGELEGKYGILITSVVPHLSTTMSVWLTKQELIDFSDVVNSLKLDIVGSSRSSSSLVKD